MVLYPEEVWNEELDELRQRLNKWNANHQLIFRQFVSDVEIITMDGNGRILIPKRYLQITGIQSDVRFIGVDNKIEIWAKERAEKLFMEPKAFGAALRDYERRTENNEQRAKMKEEETTYHVPVLLKESVDAMNISPDGTYVDVTFGGGGHSREILSRLGDGGRLLGFDHNEDAERNIVNDPHFTFVRSNFRYLHNFLRYHDIGEVDAILADLGVSSHHFDDSERGFSFRFDGKLDMRMNKRAGITAADVVNTYEEERLADIFYLYGELKNSRKLASVIVKARTGQKIETIGEFLEIIKPLFGREREKKS